QIAAVSGRQSVQAAVDLVWMEPAFVLQVAVVENLRLHADVRDFLIGNRRAKGEAVVPARRQFEFETYDEVIVLVFPEPIFLLSRLTHEETILDFVRIRRSGPPAEILTIEQRFKTGLIPANF